MTSVTKEGHIEFRFFRPCANKVSVAGDFNGWSGQRLPMNHDGAGWWTTQAQLPPGEFRFRYVADGQWFTDFLSNGVDLSDRGLNSVLIVRD